MSPFIQTLHIFLSAILIAVILLQPGKGGDVAAAFGAGGGSANTVFGARGPASLLSRSTTAVAVLFMVTSITLAIQSASHEGADADTDEEVLIFEEGSGFN